MAELSPQKIIEIVEIIESAKVFVEDREEATDNIWLCKGDKGRALLKALGVEYVPKP